MESVFHFSLSQSLSLDLLISLGMVSPKSEDPKRQQAEELKRKDEQWQQTILGSYDGDGRNRACPDTQKKLLQRHNQLFSRPAKDLDGVL